VPCQEAIKKKQLIGKTGTKKEVAGGKVGKMVIGQERGKKEKKSKRGQTEKCGGGGWRVGRQACSWVNWKLSPGGTRRKGQKKKKLWGGKKKEATSSLL